MDKKQLQSLIDLTYRLCGEKETVLLADRVRSMGYGNATKAGISIALEAMVIPKKKQELLERATREVDDIQTQYTEGLITIGERYNKVIDIWAQVTEEVAQEMMGEIGTETATGVNKEGKREDRRQPSFNPIYIMADSGARGSAQQIRQLAGMRGLMAKPSGEIIETPITANFREGLNVLQYFISTHGARKGLADTALKTANSGYLTRRLVDVAQDAIITEYDCGAMDGITLGALVEGGEIIEPMGERILGRVALDDIHDPFSTSVLVKANEEIDEARVKLDRELRHRQGEDPVGAHVPGAARHLRRVLRPRSRARAQGEHRRGGRRHRRPVDRRAGHAAHDADLPHRRRGLPARGAVHPREPQPRPREVQQRERRQEEGRHAHRDEPERRDHRHRRAGARARAVRRRLRREAARPRRRARWRRTRSSPSGTRTRCRSSPRWPAT